MGAKTAISWTDATWNPIRGCSRVSQGCVHCYAEVVAARFSGPGQPYEGLARMVNGHAAWTGVVRMIPEHLADPLKWRRSRRIFVNSMSDLFHEQLTDADIAAVFGVMAAANNHTYQVLTKRPERMAELLVDDAFYDLVEDACANYSHRTVPWPLPHVWLGTSVEDQQAAEHRIPHLLATPAAVRFLSCEPLLGPIDLERAIPCGYYCDETMGHIDHGPHGRLGSLDWVITGGESGPGYRPADPDWFRSLRDQCVAAGIAYFHKQGSAFRSGQNRELDGRTWDEFPATLTHPRVRVS